MRFLVIDSCSLILDIKSLMVFNSFSTTSNLFLLNNKSLTSITKYMARDAIKGIKNVFDKNVSTVKATIKLIDKMLFNFIIKSILRHNVAVK